MPRVARNECPNTLYHLVSRLTDHRAELAQDVRPLVLRAMMRAFGHPSTDWRLLAYAISGNQWQAVVVGGEWPSSSWTRRMNSSIARNVQLARIARGVTALGSVFAGRPTSVRVPPEQLRRIISYVHLCPVREGVTEDPRDSFWTSHRAYLDLDETPAPLQVLDGLSRCEYDGSRASRLAFHANVMAMSGTKNDTIAWGHEIEQRALATLRREMGPHVSLSDPALETSGPKATFDVLVPATLAFPTDPDDDTVVVPKPRLREDPRKFARAFALAASMPMADMCSVRGTKEATHARRLALRMWVKNGGSAAELGAVLGLSRSSTYYLLHGRRAS